MKTRWWLFIDAILLGVILAHALPAFGQALPTVTPPTNWVAIVIAVGCVFLGAGLIWFIRDRPGAVAKAKEEGSGVAQKLAASLHILTASHREAVATIPIALAATPPAKVPTTPEEKMAAIDAAWQAYVKACADAGISV